MRTGEGPGTSSRQLTSPMPVSRLGNFLPTTVFSVGLKNSSAVPSLGLLGQMLMCTAEQREISDLKKDELTVHPISFYSPQTSPTHH